MTGTSHTLMVMVAVDMTVVGIVVYGKSVSMQVSSLSSMA